MPEGDTVHRTADRLHRALVGRVVQRAELRWPRVPDVDLAGARTLEVVARGKHLLVIGGAGGVGSMAIQLARHAGFRVIATASRTDSRQWCLQLGAEAVINHHQPLAPQLAALGVEQVEVVLNLADTDGYWDQIGQLIAPQGHVGLIVEPTGALRIGDPYKAKSVSIHWEFMFTRSRFATADMAEQHRILKRAASMVDAVVTELLQELHLLLH